MCPSAPGSSTSKSITVVLARFDDLLTGGLRKLIEGDPSLEIVADDVEQRRISVVLGALRPDVAILDMAELGKLADVRELSIEHPGTQLVLFAHALSTVESAQLLAFGASACLPRGTQARDVLNAIHLASRGLQLIPRVPSPGVSALAGGHLLTQREAEVLPLLQQGQTNPQIALELHVGVETVRTHARNIYRKLGISSRRELVVPPAREGDQRQESPVSVPRRRTSYRRERSRRGHDMRR
jgi:DNA-binding NarL/FixJ family response regulator